jgi:hypothetical protein
MKRTYDDYKKIEGVNMDCWNYLSDHYSLDLYESYLAFWEQEQDEIEQEKQHRERTKSKKGVPV